MCTKAQMDRFKARQSVFLLGNYLRKIVFHFKFLPTPHTTIHPTKKNTPIPLTAYIRAFGGKLK